MDRPDKGISLGPPDRITHCETVVYMQEAGSIQLVTYQRPGDEDVEAVWLTGPEVETLRRLLNERREM